MRLALVLFFALSLWAEETLLHFSHTYETQVLPDRLSAGMTLAFTRSGANEAKAIAKKRRHFCVIWKVYAKAARWA